MSKQRRRRMKRTKHTRSFVRNGVEQLESRVLPGGFLDLLAGAAVASNFELLPEEQLISEEVETESDASVQRTRSTHSILQVGLSLGDLDFEPSEDRVELDPSSEVFESATASPATKSLPATSLIDSFFATNQFVTPSPNHLVTPSPPPLSTPSRSFSSPISQLGAGIGIGSGQGYNVTGAELPQASVGSSVAPAASVPAWMLGEGEGTTTVSGTAVASTSASGSGTTSVSGTGVVVGTGTGGGTTVTSLVCENLPSEAAPSTFYRQPGETANIDDPDFQPTVHTMDDASDEGVVIGTAGTDETGSFPLPMGTPFADDSFLAWLEITSYKNWEEYHRVIGRANGNPTETYSHIHEVSKMKSHSTSTTYGASASVSREISAGAEIEVVNIASKLGVGITLSAEFTNETSSSMTVSDKEQVTASPCQTVGLYQKIEVTEVTMKYVHYSDEFGVGWWRTPNAFHNIAGQAATITITSYVAENDLLLRAKSGNIVAHTYNMP
jgi:hypothetical protein